MKAEPRIVVTGIGAVCAFGWGTEALRAGLLSGTTAIDKPSEFDTENHRTHLAGEVPAAPESVRYATRGWDGLSKADQFAQAAATEAVRHAGLVTEGAPFGVFFGGSTAGMLESEEWYARLIAARPGRARLRLLASQLLNGPGDAVARHLRVTGPVQSISSACASGGLAIGAAIEALRSGAVEVAIAGGSDSLCQLTYGGFNSLRSVDADPCRPFRSDRAGLSLGEGAGVLVLESLGHADHRGARPIAEVLGYGASCDAHHMTAPHPDGDGILEASRVALKDAGLGPSDVTFINSHGTGTAHNDSAECRAYQRLFESRLSQVPVTATKAAIGHVLGAAGALEAVSTVLAFCDRVVYPCPGDQAGDPDLGIDLVVGRKPHLEDESTAVSTNLAFGGANVAVVLRSWAGSPA